MAKAQEKAQEKAITNGNNGYLTLHVTKQAGRTKDSETEKEFKIVNFPTNGNSLQAEISKMDAGQKATLTSLLETQIKVFARGKVEDGETVEFLDVLSLEKRENKASKIALLYKAIEVLTDRALEGEVSKEEFQAERERLKAEIAELEKPTPRKKKGDDKKESR